MSSQHTPGPWKASQRLTAVYGPPEPGWDQGRLVASCGGSTGRPKEEQAANAQLIATAPELLEACRLALDYVERRGDEGMPLYDVLFRAIAKATGEQP